MDFSRVKSIEIPEGRIKQIAVAGSPIWKLSISPEYDYGDGHLNTVNGGYNNAYYYTSSSGVFQKFITQERSSPGNIDATMQEVTKATNLAEKTVSIYGLRTNSYINVNFVVDAIDEDKTIIINLAYDANKYISTPHIKELKITVNGLSYTLQQAVTAGVIKPLVLFAGWMESRGNQFETLTELYTGGFAGLSATYPNAGIVFMLNKGNQLSKVSYWVNTGSYKEIGHIYSLSINDYRIVATLPQ